VRIIKSVPAQLPLDWGALIWHRCLQKAPNQAQLREYNQEHGHANQMPLQWGIYILHRCQNKESDQ